MSCTLILKSKGVNHELKQLSERLPFLLSGTYRISRTIQITYYTYYTKISSLQLWFFTIFLSNHGNRYHLESSFQYISPPPLLLHRLQFT